MLRNTLQAAEQQRALQWATHANEAYQALKSPLSRARYLLSLHGVDTAEQTNTAMPVAFLMAQMDWRDEMAAAQAGRDAEALEALSHTVCEEARTLTQALATLLEEIEQQLTRPSINPPDTSLVDGVNLAVERFEVEHPTVAGTLRNILQSLANMGI